MDVATIVWFKRDLRAVDHPALAYAAALGPVLPVYVVEPEYWRSGDGSGRQWAFAAECLEDLRGALAELGAPLIVRVGEAASVFEKLCNAHGITRIVSNLETGGLWAQERDRRVAEWARAAGIRWDVRAQAGEEAMPAALPGVAGVEPGQVPTGRALRLAEDRCAHRQAGGRARGQQVLGSFLTLRGEPYRVAMSSVLTGERACSRLSPYLAFGALSPGEVARATALRRAERPGGRWGGSLACFQGKLGLRARRIGEFDGGVAAGPCGEVQDPQPHWREPDPVRLAAWARGETGLPFVDACMRYLAATGWLGFSMRAMVAAVATGHLGLDRRASGTVLARMFTDYEPAIHWAQMRGPKGGLCNPVRLGREQDPAGVFTRRWVSELAGVPDRFLHEPWKWHEAGGLLGRRYPEPIVDVAAAIRAAGLAEGSGVRMKAGPARVRGAPGQLCLDL